MRWDGGRSCGWFQGVGALWYSIYLLCWYKSTNTDEMEGAARTPPCASLSAVEVWGLGGADAEVAQVREKQALLRRY